MPPSPALRYSPGRDPRVENHKRGRSLEGGLLFKERDDDLALFNEMQSKERDNFLLQPSDNFEDTFSSKLRHFSNFKLGISIPLRGESSELLNADGEKNDYDWLLTPPDTPLFPSLDDEPPPVNVPSRGRPRSQPISLSRSSTMDKGYRSSRGSPSPSRLSPSPRSGNSTFQSRGRTSLAPHSSPTPTQVSTTSSRRPSTPSKASTTTPRPSTPTPRRMSTGSGARGTSPIRTSRGNSASPKIRLWQSNIPGFSSEAPPNLRTSLADRPASYVRGSSPASRNGMDSSSKFGRQSMSPTASRSVSSSHSQDRDRNSSYSKGSIGSSGDDDVDSLHSIHVGSLDRLSTKRIGAFPNNRAPMFTKKSTRILSPSSAPKRSFDSAPRQMDHRKSPQNMFRPLLSSVPTTTFYAGKAGSAHRSLISRNSSVTTSSNASSDQCTSVAPDTEGSDHHQEDMFESRKVPYPDVQEEVFLFDKEDALNKDVGHDADDGSLHFQGDPDRDPTIECEPGDSEEFSHQDGDVEIGSASDTLCVKADLLEVDSLENMKVCSKCGRMSRVVETVELAVNLCANCCRHYDLLAATTPETVLCVQITEEYKPFDEPEAPMATPQSQLQVSDIAEVRASWHEVEIEQGQTSSHEQNHNYSLESSLTRSSAEEGEQMIASHLGLGQPTLGYSQPDSYTGGQQLSHTNDHRSFDYPSSKDDVSDGAGISLLLRRSSSSKGPLVQGRTFIASTITYDDLSYARDSLNSLRSSIGHGNSSASSSVDFSSARQVEIRVQRQLSGKKSDMVNYRYDINMRSQSTGSSLSGTSNRAHQDMGIPASTHEENDEVSIGNMKHGGMEETTVASHRELLASDNKVDAYSTSFTGAAVPVEDLFDLNESSRTMDASNSDLSCHKGGIQLEENPGATVPNYENSRLHENEEDFQNNARIMWDVEASEIPPQASNAMERSMLNNGLDGLDVAEVSPHDCLASISEIEVENHCQFPVGSDNDETSTISKSTGNEFQDLAVTAPSDKDVAASLEHSTSDHVHVFMDESTVMVECRGGSKSRSLTLEEATDTILFCSSIVHDLAYQAATIAIENESPIPLEGSQPTVTILGKSTADRKDPHSRTTRKHCSKSLKVRRRQVETDVKPLSSCKIENDENANESMVCNVGLPNKMDSTKPPKLESKCNCTIM